MKNLPGEDFSGLELMCLLHAGLQHVVPGADSGMDLVEPFLTSLGMFQSKGE